MFSAVPSLPEGPLITADRVRPWPFSRLRLAGVAVTVRLVEEMFENHPLQLHIHCERSTPREDPYLAYSYAGTMSLTPP
jgi:hypothetical protein